MSYLFEYNGGVLNNWKPGATAKFCLFFLSGGKEIPFWEAQKNGWMRKPEILPQDMSPKYTYETDIPIVRIYLHEHTHLMPMFKYSYYIKLNESINQKVTIQPLEDSLKSYSKWRLNVKGKILTNKEVLENYLERDSIGFRMLVNQSPVPIETHRKVLTVVQPRAVEERNKMRLLRV